MVTADEIFQRLSQAYDLSPDAERVRGAAPAETFLVDGGGTAARVGIIASVTRPFCGACDRVRLTADGQVRNCLFAREESDLRSALRGGASDEEIAGRWRVAVAGKLPGHGINDPSFLQPDRPMSAIGAKPPRRLPPGGRFGPRPRPGVDGGTESPMFPRPGGLVYIPQPSTSDPIFLPSSVWLADGAVIVAAAP